MNNQYKTFNYNYSSSQQKEIDTIRKKYVSIEKNVEIDKMEQLRRLDAQATNKATIPSFISGILGALVMGTGMSLFMTDLGKHLGMSSPIVPGIILGIIGMAGVIFAYPLYHHIIKKERKKIAPQILKLTDELSKK